jgi:D-lactate dehydrogenase
LFFEDNSGHIVHDDILARLISMPNVLITSHQAFLTEEALENIAETTLGGINDYFELGTLKNEVRYN